MKYILIAYFDSITCTLKSIKVDVHLSELEWDRVVTFLETQCRNSKEQPASFYVSDVTLVKFLLVNYILLTEMVNVAIFLG